MGCTRSLIIKDTTGIHSCLVVVTKKIVRTCMRMGDVTSNFHRTVYALINETTVSRRIATSSLPSTFCPINTAAAYRRCCARRVLRICFMIPRDPITAFYWAQILSTFSSHVYIIFSFFILPRRIAGTPRLPWKRVIRSSIITCEIVYLTIKTSYYTIKKLSSDKNENISDGCENCRSYRIFSRF